MKGNADGLGGKSVSFREEGAFKYFFLEVECADDMVQDREEARKYEIDAGKARAAFRTLARWLATASREAIQKPRDMVFFLIQWW